jgi:shikimate dehydrogenase
MLEALSGETRLFALIGHPIAQVMSPAGMTRALAASGRNAAVIPLHVEPAAVDSLIDSLVAVHNIDGILATVPHKFTAYRHAATATARAHTLGAANILRRNADRTWHGDMLDGVSMVAAIRTAAEKSPTAVHCWLAPAALAAPSRWVFWTPVSGSSPFTTPICSGAMR